MWKKVELTGLTPVASLEGAALDWAVAKCEGRDQFFSLNLPKHKEHCFSRMAYSTDWALAGPIVERENINLSAYQLPEEGWQAWPNYGMSDWYSEGPTPLIAAMRCYVASKLGNEIELPDELGEK